MIFNRIGKYFVSSSCIFDTIGNEAKKAMPNVEGRFRAITIGTIEQKLKLKWNLLQLIELFIRSIDLSISVFHLAVPLAWIQACLSYFR